MRAAAQTWLTNGARLLRCYLTRRNSSRNVYDILTHKKPSPTMVYDDGVSCHVLFMLFFLFFFCLMPWQYLVANQWRILVHAAWQPLKLWVHHWNNVSSILLRWRCAGTFRSGFSRFFVRFYILTSGWDGCRCFRSLARNNAKNAQWRNDFSRNGKHNDTKMKITKRPLNRRPQHGLIGHIASDTYHTNTLCSVSHSGTIASGLDVKRPHIKRIHLFRCFALTSAPSRSIFLSFTSH